MSERLTDEELDAMVARFSPGRHPKIAAALAELKEFRDGERKRALDVLLDGVAAALTEALAKKAAAMLAAQEPDEMTARRQAEADGEWDARPR